MLTDQARAALLAQVVPVFDTVVAHHVTHQFGVYDTMPPDADTVRVVAVAQNDMVQAAVVKVNGTTARDYGDSFYHVTVSLNTDAGAKPNDANALVKDSTTWTAVVPFDLDVTPQFFPF